ncbi:unnamed protein product, partial [Urochloa humidicola]
VLPRLPPPISSASPHPHPHHGGEAGGGLAPSEVCALIPILGPRVRSHPHPLRRLWRRQGWTSPAAAVLGLDVRGGGTARVGRPRWRRRRYGGSTPDDDAARSASSRRRRASTAATPHPQIRALVLSPPRRQRFGWTRGQQWRHMVEGSTAAAMKDTDGLHKVLEASILRNEDSWSGSDSSRSGKSPHVPSTRF